MYISPNLRAAQTIRPSTLKATAKKELESILRYIRIRNWEYLNYTELLEKAGEVPLTRLYLNTDMQIIGEKDKPIAVLYLLGNQVGAYVQLTGTTVGAAKLGRMSPFILQQLPPLINNKRT